VLLLVPLAHERPLAIGGGLQLPDAYLQRAHLGRALGDRRSGARRGRGRGLPRRLELGRRVARDALRLGAAAVEGALAADRLAALEHRRLERRGETRPLALG